MTRPTRLALFATILLPIQFPGCDPVLLRGAELAPARVTLPARDARGGGASGGRVPGPVDVPGVTVFAGEAEFGNTARNPLNPQDVARGEGTADGPGGTVRARPLTDPAAYRPAR
ncbi:hypothetical protein [Urbifossiella limnaea]|uniref:Uncharacterized protein n=1 Tax=Urbifossiella limnaea TaxID=2528023 RepID=A0A517Y166_9BACT|nr:hypothetical protein [Urbifossiella limnaea]QDU23511.1 hypothetical protein ETAA1_55110 [Urbifossiella limnaea]